MKNYKSASKLSQNKIQIQNFTQASVNIKQTTDFDKNIENKKITKKNILELIEKVQRKNFKRNLKNSSSATSNFVSFHTFYINFCNF